MSDSIYHQDASGRTAPLGVFRDGELIEVVPADDRLGDATRERVRNQFGDVPLEVLATCRDHPDAAAVDCLICVPED